MNKISFIGMGNMAQALVVGFIKSQKIKASDIFAYAPNQEKLSTNSQKFGFTACKTLKEAVQNTDIIFIACKPYHIDSVLGEIGRDLKDKVLISIALGWNFHAYEKALSAYTVKPRIQFVMPNTPATVSEGVFLFEKSNSLKQEERAEIWELFSTLGLVEEIADNLMPIAGAISGCGPAFVDLFIESYADAAVKYGLPRELSYRLVSQTLLGSAKLQKETEEHPAVLKDKVCSPGGSTIRGVTALEEAGFRNACIKSIDCIMSK